MKARVPPSLDILARRMLGRDLGYFDCAWGLLLLVSLLGFAASSALSFLLPVGPRTARFLAGLVMFFLAEAWLSLSMWSALEVRLNKGPGRSVGISGLLAALLSLLLLVSFFPAPPGSGPFLGVSLLVYNFASWLILGGARKNANREHGPLIPLPQRGAGEDGHLTGVSRQAGRYLKQVVTWYGRLLPALALTFAANAVLGPHPARDLADILSHLTVAAVVCVPAAVWMAWFMALERWRQIVHFGSVGLAACVVIIGLATFRSVVSVLPALAIFLAGLLVVLFVKPGMARSDVQEPPAGTPG